MNKTRQVAVERDRNYLRGILLEGDLTKHPGIEEQIQLALDSSDPELVAELAPWVRIQRIGQREEVKEKQPATFIKPKLTQLKGDLFVGSTLQSHYPVFLKKESLGGPGHLYIAGMSGSGKSFLAN